MQVRLTDTLISCSKIVNLHAEMENVLTLTWLWYFKFKNNVQIIDLLCRSIRNIYSVPTPYLSLMNVL